MIRPLFISAAIFMVALNSAKADQADILNEVVDQYIVPSFVDLNLATQDLASTAQGDCVSSSAALRKAYHNAYDAWLGVAHLQIGPLEDSEFAFALSFWPDPRGKTAKALRRLIAEEDPIVTSPDYAKVSVAARGFLALERMLFDDTLDGDAKYKCLLTRAIATDISRTSQALRDAWIDTYSAMFKSAGDDGHSVFPKREDAFRKLYTSVMTSLGFDAEARVGRPLGKIDRPRPKRAEAWRSSRPLRNLQLSIAGQRTFASILTKAGQDDTTRQVDTAFRRVLDHIDQIENPVLDATGGPNAWLKMDILKQDIVAIQVTIDGSLGRDLGLFVGFNSRDGD